MPISTATLTMPVQPRFRATHGETVTGTAVEIAILARQGVVNLSDPPLARSVADAPNPRRKAGRYRRRDLRAEE